METIAAADAKAHFGALLDKAQREPVTISKNGRTVAVIMSAAEFEEHQRLKLEWLRRDVGQGMEEFEAGKTVGAGDAFAAMDRELED